MCKTQLVDPVNLDGQRIIVDLNVTEAAYVLACLAKFSSRLLTGDARNVYDELYTQLDRADGGPEARIRVEQKRDGLYSIRDRQVA